MKFKPQPKQTKPARADVRPEGPKTTANRFSVVLEDGRYLFTPRMMGDRQPRWTRKERNTYTSESFARYEALRFVLTLPVLQKFSIVPA